MTRTSPSGPPDGSGWLCACYNPGNRHERASTWSDENPNGRWRCFSYDEILERDKVSLDIFWVRDESMEDSASLPEPHVLASRIVDELQSALDQFAQIAEDIGGKASE